MKKPKFFFFFSFFEKQEPKFSRVKAKYCICLDRGQNIYYIPAVEGEHVRDLSVDFLILSEGCKELISQLYN